MGATRQKPSKPRLELTPLIDVVFILLIFFAVTTTLITNKQGLKLELPAAETIAEHKKGIILSISKEGKLFVDKKPLALTGVQPIIRQEIKKNKKVQVLLHADQTTPYQVVIDVLDQVRLAGCYDIVLKAKRK